ncbi:MAG TPA: hypothetical protein VGK29_04545 [Paludibaculum sp.]|jgi:hypothetical protein
MQSQSRQFYLLALLLCTTLEAAEKGPTSFMDGTWKLNAAKSDGGPRDLPASLSIKVTTNGPEFEGLQTIDGGEMLLKFRSDGTEVVNQLPGGVEMRGKHRVENGAVYAEYRIITNQMEITQSDKIVVSADGKTLTTEREVKTTQGSFKQKLVFDRQ